MPERHPIPMVTLTQLANLTAAGVELIPARPGYRIVLHVDGMYSYVPDQPKQLAQ